MTDGSREPEAGAVKTWRPASARAPVTARLEDDVLYLEREDGPVIWQTPLDAVREARLVHHSMGGQIMMRLDLTIDAETVRRLEINHPVRGPSQPLSDYTAMVVRVLRRLSEISPELPYFLGESRGASTVLVALGITIAIMGVGAGGILIAEGGAIQGIATGAIICLGGLAVASANLGSARENPARPLARALDEDAGAG